MRETESVRSWNFFCLRSGRNERSQEESEVGPTRFSTFAAAAYLIAGGDRPSIPQTIHTRIWSIFLRLSKWNTYVLEYIYHCAHMGVKGGGGIGFFALFSRLRLFPRLFCLLVRPVSAQEERQVSDLRYCLIQGGAKNTFFPLPCWAHDFKPT